MTGKAVSSSSSGIGFCGFLTILFITLKLTHYIDWSWWYVLMPLWLPSAIIILILIAVFSFVWFFGPKTHAP